MHFNHNIVAIVLSRNFQYRSLIILQVISGLISASELTNDPGKFAESRRDALKSLARYLKLA